MTGYFSVPSLLFLHLSLFYSTCSQQTGLFSPPCSRSGGMLVYLYIKTRGPCFWITRAAANSSLNFLRLVSVKLQYKLVVLCLSPSCWYCLLASATFPPSVPGTFNTKLKGFRDVLSTAAAQEDYANRIDVGKRTGKPTVYSPQLKKSQSDGTQSRMEAQATEQGDDTSCWHVPFFTFKVDSVLHGGVSYLNHFPLWAFREDQDLVVERIQRLPHWLGLLLSHTDPVLQEVNLDVGRWNDTRVKYKHGHPLRSQQ